ncbi:MAG: RAMP superfamily CRISPR-associated protein [Thermotogota bacterium]
MNRMDSDILYRVKVTITALTPLLVGGREPDRYVHLSSSADGNGFIIPSSSIKGAIIERIKNIGETALLDFLGSDEKEGDIKLSEMKSTRLGKDYDERVRVSINPKTRTADAGHLFLLAAAPKGSRLEGHILFKREIPFETFRHFKRLLTSFPLFVGGGQTSGFGKVKIELGEPEQLSGKLINSGLWQINLKPLTPYTSKPVSGRLQKSYFVPSKEVIEASAILKVFKAERSGWFFPSDSPARRCFPVPLTYYQEKTSDTVTPIDLIKELLYSRMKNAPFLLAKKETGARLIPMKGFASLGAHSEIIKVLPITSYHVKRNEKVKTVEDFWFQASYKPEYFCGTLLVGEAGIELPSFTQLGGSRGKGYGLFEVESPEPYKLWDTWERTVTSCSDFFASCLNPTPDGSKFFIPLLITSPTIPDSSLDQRFKLVQEFSKRTVVRRYLPDTGQTTLVPAVSPGSVWILQPVDDSLPLAPIVESLKQLKLRGIGSQTENGFGDFEIYPWR